MLTQGCPLHMYCLCLLLYEIKYSCLFLIMPIFFYSCYFDTLSVKYNSLLIFGIIKMLIYLYFFQSKHNHIVSVNSLLHYLIFLSAFGSFVEVFLYIFLFHCSNVSMAVLRIILEVLMVLGLTDTFKSLFCTS